MTKNRGAYQVGQHPTQVSEVVAVQKPVRVLPHPRAKFPYAFSSDRGLGVAISVHKDTTRSGMGGMKINARSRGGELERKRDSR